MADADDDQKEAYFLRLQLLVTKYGTECLRKVFDIDFPPADLKQDLQNHTSLLMKLRKKHILKTRQHRLLFPPNGPPLSTRFDITLIVTLLRNITTTFKAPKRQPKLWDEDDNNKITGNDAVSDIVRIRNIRNEVGICTTCVLECTR